MQISKKNATLNQIQRTVSSSYFITLKEPVSNGGSKGTCLISSKDLENFN
jgi:hypothetical protein